MSDLETDAAPYLSEDELSNLSERPDPVGACDKTAGGVSPAPIRKTHWLPSRESSVDPELPNDGTVNNEVTSSTLASKASQNVDAVSQALAKQILDTETLENRRVTATTSQNTSTPSGPDLLTEERSQNDPNPKHPDCLTQERSGDDLHLTLAENQDVPTTGRSLEPLLLERNPGTLSLRQSDERPMTEHNLDILMPERPEIGLLERSEDNLATPERSEETLAPQQSLSPLAQSSSIPESTSFESFYDDDKSPDVVILHHDNCLVQAELLQSRLQKSEKSRKRMHVMLGGEFGRSGATEIGNLDELLDMVPCILLLIEKHFAKDSRCQFTSDVSLSSSLINIQQFASKEFVIPVFLEKKDDIPGIKSTMKAMTGISYFDEKWNSFVETNFIRQIERCLNNFIKLKKLHLSD